MKTDNNGFSTERFHDEVIIETTNSMIAPIRDYYLIRNPEPKNDGYELTKPRSWRDLEE